MSLEKLNNDMYTKQIEWKNKKDEYNKKGNNLKKNYFYAKNVLLNQIYQESLLKMMKK